MDLNLLRWLRYLCGVCYVIVEGGRSKVCDGYVCARSMLSEAMPVSYCLSIRGRCSTVAMFLACV